MFICEVIGHGLGNLAILFFPSWSLTKTNIQITKHTRAVLLVQFYQSGGDMRLVSQTVLVLFVRFELKAQHGRQVGLFVV